MEVGSEFPWTDSPGPPHLAWPRDSRWYALGRVALTELWRNFAAPARRLFLPSFFCASVVTWLRQAGLPIATYHDLPSERTPDVDSIKPNVGDMVMALNYFGVRSGEFWSNWKDEHADVTLIEDHTHDPFSVWAQRSTADYAFASVRKTFPTPDGAILWSPVGRQLPCQQVLGDWRGSATKLAGMALKRDFLEQSIPTSERREAYRRLETEGEAALESHGGPAIAPWSRQLLQQGFPHSWRSAREQNVRQFVRQFQNRIGGNTTVDLLFCDWPQAHCPFNPLLVFRSEAVRDVVRAHMIRSGVFTPIHWCLDACVDKRAAQLSARLLTIPLDHRCTRECIPRIVEMIRDCLGIGGRESFSRLGIYPSPNPVLPRKRLPTPETSTPVDPVC